MIKQTPVKGSKKVKVNFVLPKESAAGTDDNLIPRLVDAARVEATVGEMAAALKEVWGEYTEPPRF